VFVPHTQLRDLQNRLLSRMARRAEPGPNGPHSPALSVGSRLSLRSAGMTNREFNAASRLQFCSMLTAIAGALASTPAHAADYYAGKTLEFVVGADAGGGYDIYARTVARHLARHIPGSPNIIVKNMPGAGSTRAGVYIGTVAPKDGGSLGAMMPGAIMGPLLDDKPNTQFDPTRVIYIGTADSGVRVCVTFQNSKIKTFEDARTGKTILGATAAGGATRDYAYLHNKTAGTKFEVVSGYQGTVEIALAMERGEVDGLCGWDWSSVKSQKADWVRDRKLNLLAQVALDPEPELTRLGVPPIWNYVSKDEDRKVAELVISQQVFQRSYIAPPGTPAEQIGILRTGFDATMKDEAFLADAEKMRLSITPLSGAKVQELIDRLYKTPKALVDRARTVIKP
jgi:tripartite-type tricarboxylate transporter receptor subunit TctC